MGWPTTFSTLIATEKDRGLVEIVRDLAESWCLECNCNMVEASRVLESPPRGRMVEPALEHLGQVHRVFSINPSFEPHSPNCQHDGINCQRYGHAEYHKTLMSTKFRPTARQMRDPPNVTRAALTSFLLQILVGAHQRQWRANSPGP